MKQILTMVEKYLGPKLSAVAVAATTAVGQISSALGVSDGDEGIVDIMVNAAQTDLISFLPAPIAGIAAFLLRKTQAPVEPAVPVYHTLDTSPIGRVPNAETRKVLTSLDQAVLIRLKKVEAKTHDQSISIEALAESYDDLEVDLGHTNHLVEGLMDAMQLKVVEPEIDLGIQLPLNLRQNNPGNIEATVPGGNRWNGEEDSTNRYAMFSSAAYGVRAMMYLLRKVYFERHGLTTVHDIIHRWAPLGDNSPESVQNYITSVSTDIGVQPSEQLRLTTDANQLVAMMKAMAEFEGGRPLPYAKSVYTKALELLG
jgi:hypothetical protein